MLEGKEKKAAFYESRRKEARDENNEEKTNAQKEIVAFEKEAEDLEKMEMELLNRL